MRNSNIKQIAFTAIMGFFLSACGGGSSNPPSIAEIKVPQCGTAADMGKSNAKDVTGKTIKKVGDEAEVRIWHSPDSIKVACMNNGEAIVLNN